MEPADVLREVLSALPDPPDLDDSASLAAALGEVEVSIKHARADVLRIVTANKEEIDSTLQFAEELPSELSARHIAGQLGRHRRVAAQACRSFRAMVGAAKVMGMYKLKVLGVAAGARHTVVATTEGVCAFGSNSSGKLGHGNKERVWRPKWVACANSTDHSPGPRRLKVAPDGASWTGCTRPRHGYPSA